MKLLDTNILSNSLNISPSQKANLAGFIKGVRKKIKKKQTYLIFIYNLKKIAALTFSMNN